MFGMGMGELIIIAVVALLALGPDRLPGAAKSIGKTIRDLRRQTSNLKQTIEQDSQLGDAMKEIKQALRDDPFNDRPKPKPRPKPKKETEEKAGTETEAEAESETETETGAGAETETETETETGADSEAETEAEVEAESEAEVGIEADDDGPKSQTVFVEPANGVATEPRNINMSEFQKYVHMWGPQAAAEKYGTSQEEAEAAIEAVVSQASKRDSEV
jgi:sec-independent protein translocase protein TatB